MKQVIFTFLVCITICALGQLPALAGNSPDEFVGPKPGTAVVFRYSSGGMTARTIGMGIDPKGRLRVLQEMELPGKGMPHPTRAGQFLTHAYLEVFIHAANGKVFFSEGREGEAAAYLNLSQDQWTERIPLLVGCADTTPAEECPPPPAGGTNVTLRILSRSFQFYLGEQREIIKVALDVRTKEYGTSGSTTLFFVSGIGMFSPELPQNARIQHLSNEEIQAIDGRFNALMEEYRKGKSVP